MWMAYGYMVAGYIGDLHEVANRSLTCTRNVLTFVNTTAIAYRQNSAFLP